MKNKRDGRAGAFIKTSLKSRGSVNQTSTEAFVYCRWNYSIWLPLRRLDNCGSLRGETKRRRDAAGTHASRFLNWIAIDRIQSIYSIKPGGGWWWLVVAGRAAAAAAADCSSSRNTNYFDFSYQILKPWRIIATNNPVDWVWRTFSQNIAERILSLTVDARVTNFEKFLPICRLGCSLFGISAFGYFARRGASGMRDIGHRGRKRVGACGAPSGISNGRRI